MNGNLKRLRQQQALSLTDLAELASVNRVTIHRIENGKARPMPRTIRKLAQALKVSVEELTLTEHTSSEGVRK
ncbi:MAG: HTH-type transcriptional repressor RghR [Firmicutes bacterium]|nr:HTH-type transcriptional repressor RghR [Bacillota bacterium]